MRSLLLVLGSCAIFTASADEVASAPSPQTAVAAAPAASLNAPVATSSPAPASATASGGWVIRMVAPATASKSSPPAVVTATAAPATPAVLTAPSCEDIKSFKDKMHAAVDAALKYPAAMKFEPVAGVTIVTYDYQDGHTLDPHITQWSGDGRLDRAALNAVKTADFASIAPGIGHTHIHDAVIIVFDNSANIDKNAAGQDKKKDLASDRCGG